MQLLSMGITERQGLLQQSTHKGQILRKEKRCNTRHKNTHTQKEKSIKCSPDVKYVWELKEVISNMCYNVQ
jgi:hypothetical protein